MHCKHFGTFFLAVSISNILAGAIIAAPIPPEVKSVVAFILVQNPKGETEPNGTGFFVGVRHATEPKSHHIYFVTAKHVLYKANSTDITDEVVIRLNKKQGGSHIGRLPLVTQGTKRNVFIHDDPSVDLAVIPFAPNSDIFDYKFLADSMITTQESFKQLKIREGSDIFFTGLFTPYIGSQRNYPVVRFGRVALVTEEKIEWDGRLTDLYLVEAGAYGGNSGSPVFFYLGSDREPGTLYLGNPILQLAGIMQGTFLDAQAIRVIETKQSIPVSLSSMGIAAVVPAYKLHEILFSAELKQQRGES